MAYLLQVRTSDFGLQLKTEVTANTLEQLKYEASKMVKNNPIVRGMEYGIWKLVKENGKTESKLIKLDRVSK